ncbi:hypothetical protein COU57_02230 [Candidatus Pacearchaeota archaeon CG10_big_fil_rev_8_21_14_0_10_32_14]|nr:MAG: hypothetical protein COU57_02230 [Candidatus Pacearchaeota archaeon CG10_big_fil_rev_8_21_14_0_10_32_14]
MADSPVHIKMNYNEAVASKKDMLVSQMNLLKVRTFLRKYRILRAKELREKEKLKKNMNDAMLLIKKLQESLPKNNVPKIHKVQRIENVPIETYTPKDKKKEAEQQAYDNLEAELKEIQERLKALG